jgi:hypothetical protein
MNNPGPGATGLQLDKYGKQRFAFAIAALLSRDIQRTRTLFALGPQFACLLIGAALG